METVEVVVRLPKDVYTRIKKDDYKGKGKQAESDIIDLLSGLDNGTVLPNGHGDLVDMNTVTTTYNLQGELTFYDAVVVLEADKEE